MMTTVYSSIFYSMYLLPLQLIIYSTYCSRVVSTMGCVCLSSVFYVVTKNGENMKRESLENEQQHEQNTKKK